MSTGLKNTHRKLLDSTSSQRILAAAEVLFGAHGYDAVSVNAIALRAGVSKANIFHHFTSKNALYLAVLDAACKETRERIDVLQNTEGSFIEHLSHFCQEHLQSILQREHISRLILRDLLEEGETRGQELAEQVFGRNFAKFVEMIRLGQSRRELRSDIDPAALAVLLIAANVYYFQARTVLPHLADVDFAGQPQRYSNKIMQVLLQGILPSTSNK